MVLPEDAVILLVDDSPEDVKAIKRGLDKVNVHNRLIVIQNPGEALHALRGDGKYGDREKYPLPNLILLNLLMQKCDGFALLEQIRANPACKTIRVIGLAAGERIEEVNRAYDAGASACVVKPAEKEGYEDLLQGISSYWLRRNAMPEVGEAVTSIG